MPQENDEGTANDFSKAASHQIDQEEGKS